MSTAILVPPSSDLRRLSGMWMSAGEVVSELPVALAALIYVRWIGLEDARLGFTQPSKHEPILPIGMDWEVTGVTPLDVVRRLGESIAAVPARATSGGEDTLGFHLRRVRRPIERLLRMSARLVLALVEWVGRQPFDNLEYRQLLLAAFDDLLDASQGKGGGEYRTPRHVVDLMVALADPRPGERIYDPCFGVGGLLTSAHDHLLRRAHGGVAWQRQPRPAIAGAECSETAFVLALARLTLAGVDCPRLDLRDSLDDEPGQPDLRGRFDVVLANPPWGQRVDRERYLTRFLVPTSDATSLFVQRAVDFLAPGGRAAIVVPDGLLFQGGAQQELRRHLLGTNLVEAVVSLPGGSFLPHTGVKASIVLLRRDRQANPIRMVDTSLAVGEKLRAQGLDATAIARIVADARTESASADAWDVPQSAFAGLDWDLSVRRHDTGSLDRALGELGHASPVLPLASLCSVLSGRAVPRESLLARPGGEATAPYIRIGDLRDGGVGRASSWVADAGACAIAPSYRLQPGDVLLSKSGTIGKVAVVTQGASGGLPSAGLFVLRIHDDRLDPHFLAAYLDSEACRDWLNSRARGVTIQHLRQGVIGELPVPLPPRALQQRAVVENQEHRVDAVAYLAEVSGRSRNAVSEWVDRSLRSVMPDGTAVMQPMELHRLEALAKEVGELRNRVAHARTDAGELGSWLTSLSDALAAIRGIDRLPPGAVQYAALRESLYRLETTEDLLNGRKAEHANARRLNLGLARHVGSLSEAMLDRVKLTLGAVRTQLEPGPVVEVELSIQNEGALPIRDLQITAAPDWGSAFLPILERGERAAFSLRGSVPREAATVLLSCEWTARALDGRRLTGRGELPFKVAVETGNNASARLQAVAASPYVCGDPIRPERDDVFFGREKLVDDIRRQVQHSGNVILLEGNRRAGKSSVLRHLEGPEPIPGWLGIYCSLQGAEGSQAGAGVPTAEVFREIAKSIAQSLTRFGDEVPLPDRTSLRPGQRLGIARACRAGISDEAPFGDFREYLEAALTFAKERGSSLLLMLDEFDKLQEGIDNGVTSPQVPENIRFLVQTYDGLSAILTGSRRLKRLREEYWSALFGLGTRFSVTALPDEAARRLVVEPVRDVLTFSDAAVERAVELVARQPFLLQCLCSRIFERAAQTGSTSISADVVEQSAEVLVADNEHFASLWDYAGSDRRRLMLAICQREADGPDALRLGVIQERLVRLGIVADDAVLTADLEFLRELEVIDKDDEFAGGAYRLAIPLMGRWIGRQQDLEILVAKARLESEDSYD